MVENPVILGLIVFGLVWLIRNLKWPVDGLKALWLTMGVSVVIALIDWALAAGWREIVVCQLVFEPAAFLSCVIHMARTVVETAGVIFASATVIYKVLRLKIASEIV